MEVSSSTDASTTGSFQNQPLGSVNPATVKPSLSRKRGISALLADVTNHDSTSKRCKEGTATKISALSPAVSKPRGDPHRGGMARAINLTSTLSPELTEGGEALKTLSKMMKQRPQAYNKGRECINTYVCRNITFELQKAVAIQVMTAAMSEMQYGIVDAAQLSATVTGSSSQVVRRWASDYFQSFDIEEGSLHELGDDFVEDALASSRGRAINPHTLAHDEEFCIQARDFIHKNCYKKGAPNLTSEVFKKWIHETFGVNVCVETARQLILSLGFKQCTHTKGVFFDGHEREDVVQYRVKFLEILDELDPKTSTPESPVPTCLAQGENPILRVAHDESTFYSNADQTRFWSDGQVQVLRQKSLGASIMVSDFIVEGHGYLRHETDEARLLLETQKDGYFNSDMFLKQVNRAIDIFDKRFPKLTGLFFFDNAPSHRKYPEDGLNVTAMNVYSGGKQPHMRETTWNGKVQKMVSSNGSPKGMKMILEERGVDTKGMNAAGMRNELSKYEDFKEQKTLIEELVTTRGHICLFYPKFHCEVNPIERNWCHSKRVAKQYVNGSITRLRQVIPRSLDAVTPEMMDKFYRTCRDYERAYRGGYTCKDVEAAVKVYKSHRRVFSTNS